MTDEKLGLATYINTDERYGDAVAVTVSDYRQLNPNGEFDVRDDGIYEWVEGRVRGRGEWKRIARSDGLLMSDDVNETLARLAAQKIDYDEIIAEIDRRAAEARAAAVMTAHDVARATIDGIVAAGTLWVSIRDVRDAAYVWYGRRISRTTARRVLEERATTTRLNGRNRVWQLG